MPGTGCSVVSGLLKRELSAVELGRKHNSIPEMLQLGLITQTQLDHYLVVANVRNPFDRFTTYFQRYKGTWTVDESLRVQRNTLQREIDSGILSETEKRQKVARFEKGKARTRRRAQAFRFLGFNTWLWSSVTRWNLNQWRAHQHLFPMLDKVDVVIRQETLEASLNEVLAHLGVDHTISLPRRNLTPEKRPYTDYYNIASRFLLKRLYGEGIRKMGYEYGTLVESSQPIPLTEKGRSFLS